MKPVNFADMILLQNAGFDHSLCAAAGAAFLGRLKHHQYIALQLGPVPVQLAGNTGGNGGVHIMPTGVHNAVYFGRKRRAGILAQRQRINIGTQCNGFAFSGIDQNRSAGHIRKWTKLQTAAVKKLLQFFGGFKFMISKLRLLMDRLPQLEIAPNL